LFYGTVIGLWSKFFDFAKKGFNQLSVSSFIIIQLISNLIFRYFSVLIIYRLSIQLSSIIVMIGKNIFITFLCVLVIFIYSKKSISKRTINHEGNMDKK